jgi:hypothetical protein
MPFTSPRIILRPSSAACAFTTILGWSFIMKKLLVAIAIFLGSLLSAGPVAAAPALPPGAPGVIVDFPVLEGFCSFPVHVTVTGKGKLNDLPGDRVILPAPGQKVTITNLDNGKSVTYVITGATHNQTKANKNVVSTVTGRNVVLNNADSEKQGIFLLVGTFSFELDAAGAEVEPFTGIGQVTDVCAVLAR